jgi:hypothetical protein
VYPILRAEGAGEKGGSRCTYSCARPTRAVDRGCRLYLVAVAAVGCAAVSRAGSLRGVIAPACGALGFDATLTFAKNAARAFSKESCCIGWVSLIWAY